MTPVTEEYGGLRADIPARMISKNLRAAIYDGPEGSDRGRDRELHARRRSQERRANQGAKWRFE